MFKAELSVHKLTQLTRSALAHLFDHAVLQNHPLIAYLHLDKSFDRVTRGQELRRILLKCVEALKPEAPNHGQTEAVRAYAILTYRYVDGLSMPEIAEKLALSERQTYREHNKGINAVTGLILDQLRAADKDEGGAPLPHSNSGERLSIAHAEVERLRQEVRAEALDLPEVLAGVLNLLETMSQELGIRIRVSWPDVLPLVMADRILLRQALLNLLSRALNTFVRGDLVITASLKNQSVLIDISEVPPAAGRQAGRSVPPKEGQVALAVARSLIEAQEGQLVVQDQAGNWAAQILLPTSRRATILVIDDNVDIVALFKRYLGARNVAVVGTTNADQAIALAAELQPQLITLDVMMPTQDGWEILQKLKGSADIKQIPVVICSVLNQPQLARSLGASDTLIKPVSQVELLKVVRRWVGPL
ncbi:MAG: response regulator [Chloroflexota bacterium]